MDLAHHVEWLYKPRLFTFTRDTQGARAHANPSSIFNFYQNGDELLCTMVEHESTSGTMNRFSR